MKKYIFVKPAQGCQTKMLLHLTFETYVLLKKKTGLMQNENINCCYDEKRQSIMKDSINCLEMKSEYECLAHEGNSQFLSK